MFTYPADDLVGFLGEERCRIDVQMMVGNANKGRWGTAELGTERRVDKRDHDMRPETGRKSA